MDARRIIGAAFGVLALLLQFVAPLEIMPPRGQAVHFAHVRDGQAQHNAGHHTGASQQDSPSCPICYVLLAAGHSVAAAAPSLTTAIFVFAPLPPPPATEAPVAPTLPRARARPPPFSV